MSTWQYECLSEATRRHTEPFATKVYCARTLVKDTLLFWMRTEHTTHRGNTAQTERIPTRLVITTRPGSRPASSHEKRNNTTSLYCVCFILWLSLALHVHSQLFLSPHFAHFSSSLLPCFLFFFPFFPCFFFLLLYLFYTFFFLFPLFSRVFLVIPCSSWFVGPVFFQARS